MCCFTLKIHDKYGKLEYVRQADQPVTNLYGIVVFLLHEKEEDIRSISAAIQHSAHLIRFLGISDAVFSEYPGR